MLRFRVVIALLEETLALTPRCCCRFCHLYYTSVPHIHSSPFHWESTIKVTNSITCGIFAANMSGGLPALTANFLNENYEFDAKVLRSETHRISKGDGVYPSFHALGKSLSVPEIPPGYKHPSEFQANMTSEERMVVTGRVLIDTSLNKTEKFEKVETLSSDYIDKEPHSRELLKQLVELKKWLDIRLEKAGDKVQSIHDKKFKLLFAIKGSSLFKRLTRKANKIKSTLSAQEREEEEIIEKEFHAKADELKIHEIISLFPQKE